jgi:predicted metal-dependent hydrolase
MSETGSITYAGRTIGFTVTRSDAARLSITVEPDLAVRVVAPKVHSLPEVIGRVRRRGAWIVRQLNDLERFLPKQPPRRYVSGESHRYLGRQYRLKVQRAEGRSTVKLKGAYIQVATNDPENAEEVKSLLDAWYRQHARIVFAACLAEAIELHRRHGLRCERLRLQAMKTRWGSYTSSGAILLNPALIMAPRACIEYVVVHELCHSVVPNHGPKFEQLLTRCLPDWRERKARLEASRH